MRVQGLIPIFAVFTAISSAAASGVLEGRAVSTTCTNQPKATAPAGIVCNKEGSVKRINAISSGKTPNLATCTDSCLSNTQCISFSYSTSKVCKRYNATIYESAFHQSQTGVTFWNRRCFNRVCGLCPQGLTACGSECYNLRNSQHHCGSCGIDCSTTGSCSAGQCICPKGQGKCPPNMPSATCVPLNTTSNCLACGNTCRENEVCTNSGCDCGPNFAHCTGSDQPCDSLTTVSNCGSCGNACPSGSSCEERTCVCPSGNCNG